MIYLALLKVYDMVIINRPIDLTHLCLVHSSILTNWMGPFVIVGVSYLSCFE